MVPLPAYVTRTLINGDEEQSNRTEKCETKLLGTGSRICGARRIDQRDDVGAQEWARPLLLYGCVSIAPARYTHHAVNSGMSARGSPGESRADTEVD